MITLALGALIAVGALLYVVYPLFDASATPPWPPSRGVAPRAGELPLDALRDAELDRAAGKLSEEDYAVLAARYATTPADEAEAAVLRYRATRRSCPRCGPRPEPDAVFCSSCGGYLSASCPHCGAAVDAPGSRFCASCGEGLAAPELTQR